LHASVLFGSKTKGQSDEYSDNDLLIVCPDNERTHHLNINKDQKYNISFFSPTQLIMMKRIGSLFIQHIKKDGIIIYDEDGLFNNFIQNCEFIAPSINELEKCRATLSFISSIPNEDPLIGWKADFLYCVSRDFLIKKLAYESILAFGINEIAIASIKKFGFMDDEMHDLKELRKIKTIYRINNISNITDFSTKIIMNSWLDTLEKRSGIIKNKNSGVLIDTLYKKEYNSTYEALRILEAFLLIAEMKGINHIDSKVILKHITLPNKYKSLQKSKSDKIEKYIRDYYALLSN